MTPDTIIIVTSIIIGIAVIFGIYKLATSDLSERSVLKPGTSSSNGRHTIKAILAIFISILLFLAFFVTYRIFTA